VKPCRFLWSLRESWVASSGARLPFFKSRSVSWVSQSLASDQTQGQGFMGSNPGLEGPCGRRNRW